MPRTGGGDTLAGRRRFTRGALLLEAMVQRLRAEGFASGEAVGTPDGPIQVLVDPSGNEVGFLRPDRPGALEQAYADPSNTNAVR